MTLKKVTFSNFLKLYPVVDLPVILDELSHLTFSNENKPLPPALIQEYILPHESIEPDEYTEYVPCFRLPDQDNFCGIVYWRAMLMDYNYILNTYKLNGEFIKSFHIGGTKSDGSKIARLLSTIHPNLQIDMAAASGGVEDREYSAAETKVFKLQLLENGEANIEMDEEVWS